jgi:hypothetical protein
MYEKQLIIALMKQKLHDFEQCNFQFERFRKACKKRSNAFEKRSNAFENNLKSVQKVGAAFRKLASTETLATDWVWAAWVS